MTVPRELLLLLGSLLQGVGLLMLINRDLNTTILALVVMTIGSGLLLLTL